MLTAALVNEAVERRSRRRWSVLVQYVMLQLVRDARAKQRGEYVRRARRWSSG